MKSPSSFIAITSEGGLLPADFLHELPDPKTSIEGVTPVAYHLAEGERLNEQINRSWHRLKGCWENFKKAVANKPITDPTTTDTRERWLFPLFQELGFGRLTAAKPIEVDGRSYPVSHGWNQIPIHLVGSHADLDCRTPGAIGAAKASPHSLVQSALNASEAHLWGIVSNGLNLRLLRDNVALTRLAYVEFDLQAMFDGDLYSEFFVLWLVCHQSRFEGEKLAHFWLERWKKTAEDKTLRALDDLYPGVKKAIAVLGAGLVSNRANVVLLEKLRTGRLSTQEFYKQVLRVIYRMLFLLVAEDRALLHVEDDSESALKARRRYRDFYSLARLRALTLYRAGTPHPDLWQVFQLVTAKLGSDAGCPELALPPLGSFLWTAAQSTPDLLDSLISNRHFLEAVHALTFVQDGNVRRAVDYKNLGSEELGSVYQGLLEMHPRINADAGSFELDIAAGNERKTSGSYYTPDSLVQCLLDSALEPVIAERLAKAKTPKEKETALLSLKVCDKAVGSGHFLLRAAHRVARHLARVRSGEEEPSPTIYRTALRDVIGHCLYGVDINPMAVELCKVTLWLEALEPGKPLSFLDHHIRCGNSLLGTTPELISAGLPDDAFKPIEGDNPDACSSLKKLNKAQREGLRHLFIAEDTAIRERMHQAAAAIDEINDSRPEDIHRKESAFRNAQQNYDFQKAWDLANLWCAAFVIKKHFPGGASVPASLEASTPDPQPSIVQTGLFGGTEEAPKAKNKKIKAPNRAGSETPIGITTQHLRDFVEGGELPDGLLAKVKGLADQYQFFHFHLAFPEVFAQGGFDLNLGNPPWVRQELLKPVKQLLPKFRSFTSTADSSVYFMELNVQTCRPRGRVALLTPNKWFRASYADSLRQFLRERCRIVLLIDFGHSRNLFPNVDTFPAAVVFEPVALSVADSETARFVQAHDSDREHHTLPELIRTNSIDVPHGNLRADRWQLEPSDASGLLDRLLATGRPLGAVLAAPIIRGILSGLNEAFYVTTSLRNSIVSADPGSEPIFKKFLRGRDVKRWVTFWDDQWHIVIPSSQNRAWPWSNATNEPEAETIFAATHPSIHAHLKQFEQPLRARQDKGKYWWELRACDYYEDFAKPKIIVQCIAYYSQFAFDEQGHYTNNKAIVIPTDDLYLLAVLNSRITWWIVNRTFQHMKDEGLSVDVQFLKRLPVPAVGEPLYSEIASLAGEIVAASKSPTGSEQIPSLEMRLNNLVTRAFALTTAEQDVLISSLPPRDPIAELARAFPAAAGTPTQSVSDQVPKQAIIPAPIWLDRPLVLPTSRRIGLTPDRYRASVVPHLLYQAGGNVSFDRFRKAYWLLTEPKTLEGYASGTVGEIARGWARTFRDKLEKDRFIEHLKGAVGRQLHFIHEDNERWLELRDSNVADDEHVIFDARLALLVADLWPVTEPITPLAPAEEITIQELEAVL
jgi:hypothetical protein